MWNSFKVQIQVFEVCFKTFQCNPASGIAVTVATWHCTCFFLSALYLSVHSQFILNWIHISEKKQRICEAVMLFQSQKATLCNIELASQENYSAGYRLQYPDVTFI